VFKPALLTTLRGGAAKTFRPWFRKHFCRDIFEPAGWVQGTNRTYSSKNDDSALRLIRVAREISASCKLEYRTCRDPFKDGVFGILCRTIPRQCTSTPPTYIEGRRARADLRTHGITSVRVIGWRERPAPQTGGERPTTLIQQDSEAWNFPPSSPSRQDV